MSNLFVQAHPALSDALTQARNFLSKDAVETNGGEAVSLTVSILKSDDEGYILGEVLVPEEIDADNDARKQGFEGDIYSAEEIRKAAHGYMEKSQFYDLQHQELLAKSQVRVVESYLAPIDFELPTNDGAIRKIKKGTWLLGSRVLDETLKNKVKSGELGAYSIMGSAKIEIEEYEEEIEVLA